ncbi:MAG TPA: hypothetical protein VNQ90_08715 [Chthoniobacteraceae bacterium]|nr:hypothetical protein [Chthoniobacteraceae bacterium]
MKTILASLSAVALSLSFSACQTAPKHGACPLTGGTAAKACCTTAKPGAAKSCCTTKDKAAKTTKKSGASCCS